MCNFCIAHCPKQISIKYYRQEKNFGHYWNMGFGVRQASGKYLLLLDHDDWLTDPNFLSDSIAAMEAAPSCFAAFCNTLIEHTNHKSFQYFDTDWKYLQGSAAVQLIFGSLPPNKCGVVYRLDKLHELNYLDYFISKEDGERMSVSPEDAYLPLCLLSSIGDVAFSGRVVAVRGIPAGALSRTSDWQRDVGLKHFIPFYLLHRHFSGVGFAAGVQVMRDNILNKIRCEELSCKVLQHFDMDEKAVALMVGAVNGSAADTQSHLASIYADLAAQGYTNTLARLRSSLAVV
jgi:glycosyltransferase involved in cell wall biosynthesis